MKRDDGDNSMIELIRETFKASGLSMKALADKSGVFYSSVHGVIATGRDPALSTADRICRVLGLELVQVKRTKRRVKR